MTLKQCELCNGTGYMRSLDGVPEINDGYNEYPCNVCECSGYVEVMPF